MIICLQAMTSFISKAVFDYENFDQDEDGSLSPVQVNEGRKCSYEI
jgi:hypothetical protein